MSEKHQKLLSLHSGLCHVCQSYFLDGQLQQIIIIKFVIRLYMLITLQYQQAIKMWPPNNPNINSMNNINYMPNPIQQLKSLVNQVKSYKPKPKDIQYIIAVFQKYFISTKRNANFQKVIQYFMEVFISCLHINPNDKVYDCFKKLIVWLNQEKSRKNAYFLIKVTVELCQRQFTYERLKEKKNQGQESKQQQKKQKRQSLSKERQFSANRQKRDKSKEKQQQGNLYTKQNLKSVLSLIRKAGQKHMLDAQIYQIFIQYYLQRIGSQVEQHIKSRGSQKNRGNMVDERKQSQSKRVQLGSHVLSQLSTILASRNKNTAASTIQKCISMSIGTNLFSHCSLYLLLQVRNIQWLLPQLQLSIHKANRKLIYHSEIDKIMQSQLQNLGSDNILRVDSLFSYIMEELLATLGKCLKSQSYSTISYLHHLYPLPNSLNQQQLANCQHLLDRLYIHYQIYGANMSLQRDNSYSKAQSAFTAESWQKWFRQFIQSNKQYIESTSMYKDQHQNLHHSNIMGIKYVIKLYVFAAFALYPSLTKNTITNNMQRLLQILCDQLPHSKSQQHSEQQIHNLMLEQYWQLFEDCYSILFQKSRFQFEAQINENSKRQQQKWPQIIKQLSNSLSEASNRSKIVQRISQLLQTDEHKSNELQIQQWRVVMQAMFQQIVSYYKYNESRKIQSEQKAYSRYALFALESLTIRPRIIRESNSQSHKLFEISQLQYACIQILQIIKAVVGKDELVDQIKKIMSQYFDRVFADVIRNNVSKSLFLCKCLLMTNHAFKCKVLFSELLRYYDMPNAQINNIKVFLQQLLIAVPQYILIDFCRFVANRDKLQLRMILFEKQLQHLDFLLQANLFNLTSPNFAQNKKYI